MTDTGVVANHSTNGTGTTAPPSGGGKKGSFFQRNKALVIGGGALAAVILMGRNSGASAGTNAATVGQLGAEYGAGYTAGQSSGTSAGDTSGGTDSGLGGGGDTSGGGSASDGSGSSSGNAGSGGTDGTAASSAPALEINVNTANPAAAKKKTAKKPKGTTHPSDQLKKTEEAEPSKPRSAPRAAPKAADKEGKHPETKKKTRTGTKKRSPAMVESMDGANSGVTVMGRNFPGAYSHRLGAPFLEGGQITRIVVIDYGGRTETHKCIGNGAGWIDNVRGMNPPSRGVPQYNAGPAR